MWLFAQGLPPGDAAACNPRGSARGNALAAGHDHPPSESTSCFGILLACYGAGSERAAFHRARTRNSRGHCTRGTEQGDRGTFGIDEKDSRNLFNQHLPETRSRLTGSGSGSRIGARFIEAEGKLNRAAFAAAPEPSKSEHRANRKNGIIGHSTRG